MILLAKNLLDCSDIKLRSLLGDVTHAANLSC